jgi:hypothetical protein
MKGVTSVPHLALPAARHARSNYDSKSFRNDLKEVLRRAGVEGKPIMLLLGARRP